MSKQTVTVADLTRTNFGKGFIVVADKGVTFFNEIKAFYPTEDGAPVPTELTAEQAEEFEKVLADHPDLSSFRPAGAYTLPRMAIFERKPEGSGVSSYREAVIYVADPSAAVSDPIDNIRADTAALLFGGEVRSQERKVTNDESAAMTALSMDVALSMLRDLFLDKAEAAKAEVAPVTDGDKPTTIEA